MDRNDKVFTLLYKIVMHKKMSHPDEIQNIIIYVYMLNFKILFSYLITFNLITDIIMII